MKQFITDTLVRFRKSQITLEKAADRLLVEQTRARTRKAKSNRRLKRLCGALPRECNPAKVRELKADLRQEFDHGDHRS
jgi:hypothetical protein